MKPGPKDAAYRILITGRELEELKRLTWQMAEAHGLDRRIEAYQGKHPITLYGWDLDCLIDVIADHLPFQRNTETGPAQDMRRFGGYLIASEGSTSTAKRLKDTAVTETIYNSPIS